MIKILDFEVGIYMKMFITAGTNDYLNRIKNKYQEEVMVTMLNEDGALLLHETNNETVFKEPRRYEVVESNGSIQTVGFVVINYVPVTDEGRPLFEYQFKNRSKTSGQSFNAMRFLRPLASNTYIILTFWESEKTFNIWKSSSSFGNTHSGHDPKIFASASYIRKYYISE
jgi:heme oxygenase (mycobilin-producing)